jgi:hypothetical protein
MRAAIELAIDLAVKKHAREGAARKSQPQEFPPQV